MISFTFYRDPPSAFPVATVPRIARACSLLKKPLGSKKKYEVGVTFASEREIATLNRTYRRKSSPTDVLSFSLREGDLIVPRSVSDEEDLGDIVICQTVALKEAKRRGIDLKEELVRLLVHGTLHLLGYDHANERDEERMFAIQEEIVEKSLKGI